jgi:GAF domain-containing protein
VGISEAKMDISVLGDIAQAAITITGADMATVQIVTGDGLQLVGSRGFKPDFLRYFDLVRSNECSCGTALRTGAPVIVDDVRTSPVFAGKPARAPLLEAGTLSVVSMPILSRRGTILGMISPHRRAVGRPEPGELRRLEWLAGQAAQVLEGTASMSVLQGLEILART